MPVPFAPQPSSRVGLFLGGLRHDVMEYSAAGLTVPRAALDTVDVSLLRRGESCPATLQVHGEMYGVVLRLAAQGPLHVEFSFVSLAAQARGALEHYTMQPAEPEAECTDRSGDGVSGEELPGPMALAFAQLAEPVVPEGRRFILPESQNVYALTLERKHLSNEVVALGEEPAVLPEPVVAKAFVLDSRAVFVYGTALFALLALLLMWSLT